MFVNEKRFRSFEVPGIGSALGKDPELGVNKGSRRDRISEGPLQRNWDSHGWGCSVHSPRVKYLGFETVLGRHAVLVRQLIFGVYRTR